MSLMRTVIASMISITTFLLTFFFLGGAYYSLLDNLYAMATGRGIPSVTTFADWSYWVFYYGWAMLLLVFGPLVVIIYLFMAVRRKYYSTEEVYA